MTVDPEKGELFAKQTPSENDFLPTYERHVNYYLRKAVEHPGVEEPTAADYRVLSPRTKRALIYRILLCCSAGMVVLTIVLAVIGSTKGFQHSDIAQASNDSVDMALLPASVLGGTGSTASAASTTETMTAPTELAQATSTATLTPTSSPPILATTISLATSVPPLDTTMLASTPSSTSVATQTERSSTSTQQILSTASPVIKQTLRIGWCGVPGMACAA